MRGRLGVVGGAVIIAVAICLPFIGVPRAWLLYVFLVFVYLGIANMWNLLVGYSGLMCLCPAAFVGLAGYTLALSTWAGIPYYAGMVAGAVAAGLFALVISVPVFRMKGVYFAIGTLVVPEVLRYVFLMWNPVGGDVYGKGAGYQVRGVGDVGWGEMYLLALVVGIGSIVIMHFVLKGKLGLGLAAVRDNDGTAASSGVPVFRLKLYVFVVAAVVMGFAGAVFYLYQGYIEPTSGFSMQWLVLAMLATVIGGEGTREGPVVGTIVYVVLYFVLAKYGSLSLIIQGGILLGVMLVSPEGIVGAARRTRVYRWVARLAVDGEK